MDNDKKGIALVIAIIVLLGLSLMATAVMITTQSEIRMGAAHKWYVQAIDVAYAGLNEIIYRMRLTQSDPNYIGDPSYPPDPDWTAIILNTTQPPANTGDTFFYSSLQSGDSIMLDYTTSGYTTAEEQRFALKIHYKHKGNLMYFYDQRHDREILGSPSLADAYSPVIIAEITGRAGRAKRRVVVEMAKYTITSNLQSGLSANAVSLYAFLSILSSRDLRVDAHVCKSDVPWWTVPATEKPSDHVYDIDIAGLGYVPNDGFGTPLHWTYETNAAGDTELYHVRRFDGTFHPRKNMEFDDKCGMMGCLPGIITPTLSGGGLNIVGSSNMHIYGNPDVLLDPDYRTPEIWELLGFHSENEMNSYIDWTTVTNQTGYDNLMYTSPADADNHPPRFIKVDNAGGGTITLNGYGRGILWITGDASTPDATGTFLSVVRVVFGWKGIVYIGGDLSLNTGDFSVSDTWVLGAVAVKGNIDTPGWSLVKGLTFYTIYSPYIINYSTQNAIGRFIVIDWREIR